MLERQPDWTALPRKTPPVIADLLKRCLEKDARRRPSDIAGVLALLDWGTAKRTRPQRSRAALVTAIIVVLLAIGFGVSRLRVRDGSGPIDPLRWEQLTNFPDSVTQPALSADGRMLAFVRGEHTFATPGEVYLKHLAGGEATPLTRDGSIKMDPTFSPDSNRIAYTVVGDPTEMSGNWDTWEVGVVRGEPGGGCLTRPA